MQHYLVQITDIKDNLFHYGNETPDKTVIRGHKLYWHRGKVERSDLQAKPNTPKVNANGAIDKDMKASKFLFINLMGR